MPKKSSGRRKGIQRALQRCRVGSKVCVEQQDGGRNHETDHGPSLFRRLTSVSIARFCFNLMFSVCEKLRLIGFSRTQDGDYVLLEGRARMLHYAAVVWYIALSIQKIWSTLLVFIYDDLGPVSFVCLTFASTHVCGFVLGAGLVLRPQEIMDVLKSWSYDLPSFGTMNGNSKFHPFDDFSTRLKVLIHVGMLVTAVCPLTLMTTSLNLPVSFVPLLANSFGMPLESILPLSAWKVLFLPLEFVSILAPMIITAFSASSLFMGTSALQIYLGPVRKMKVRSVHGRARMERAYVEVEIFCRIFQTWVRRFFPLWLVEDAVGIILSIFIAIRYTGLPLILYLNFPPLGMLFLLILFCQSYDMVQICRASEDTLEVLGQHHAPYFRGMARTKRIELMKRAKAMRPLVFPLADSEFSINVPVDAWEEIINQILFLLSL